MPGVIPIPTVAMSVGLACGAARAESTTVRPSAGTTRPESVASGQHTDHGADSTAPRPPQRAGPLIPESTLGCALLLAPLIHLPGSMGDRESETSCPRAHGTGTQRPVSGTARACGGQAPMASRRRARRRRSLTRPRLWRRGSVPARWSSWCPTHIRDGWETRQRLDASGRLRHPVRRVTVLAAGLPRRQGGSYALWRSAVRF